MVVISFYRGNLHRVPDTPRRWPMPKPSISLQNFKLLLDKRKQALSRLDIEDDVEGMGDNGCKEDEKKTSLIIVEEENKRKREEIDGALDPQFKCPKITPNAPLHIECDPVEKAKMGSDWEEMDADSHRQESSPVPHPKLADSAKPIQEASNSADAPANKVKRKNELESKLKVLTEEKHHLVQMLKHILSSEEEMKKRSQMTVQASAMHATLSYQGEATFDIGSVMRQSGRRIGAELNLYGDLEEGELEDACTPSPHSNNVHHVHAPPGSSGTVLGCQSNGLQQPSQSFQQTKTGLTAVGHSQHSTNVSTGIMASPSLFGLHGPHSQHAPIPPVSISGAQVAASSPSPATSSGTSIFRATRRTSPSWNQR